MRTTIALDDHLLKAAKTRARAEGLTLGQFVEEALRLKIHEPKTAPRQATKLPVFTGGTGVRPGIDLTSNRALLEALDENRRLEDLR